ncbi:hypothetical protein BT63DRAFT_449884 [Microthyrium microscopicum]|uniref:Uncharacterized protein n=1 Tax=Microthyrium microscopicum TaxID=703497 RepID=A0A6A6UVA2_9PEZI|nr:hypothetical protein BT63DRAFT_449884 [Microthyrium microscopicum]
MGLTTTTESLIDRVCTVYFLRNSSRKRTPTVTMYGPKLEPAEVSSTTIIENSGTSRITLEDNISSKILCKNRATPWFSNSEDPAIRSLFLETENITHTGSILFRTVDILGEQGSDKQLVLPQQAQPIWKTRSDAVNGLTFEPLNDEVHEPRMTVIF